MSYREAIPLVVLTGFLGSGKTTLLNAWLRDTRLRNCAVLINEFGEIGLDHQLVEPMDGSPVLLANGCVCCSIREDLKTAILNLDARRLAGDIPAFTRLVIETTGVADPAPILATLLNDPELRHHYRLGTVVTVVDARHGPQDLRLREEALKQAALADQFIITKRDLVSPAAVAALEQQLRAINPGAQFAAPSDAGVLVNGDVYDPALRGEEVLRWLAPPSPVHTHAAPAATSHLQAFASFSVTLDQPLDWVAFGVWLTMLLHVHGNRVLRVKGILNVAGSATPVVINGVQHLVHPPFHLAAWPDADRRSRLVFITEGLSHETLGASLAVFSQLGARLRPVADFLS